MSDVLIRNVSPRALRTIDAHAAKLGLPRSEYLRRRIEQDAESIEVPCSPQDFERFSNLADEDLMRQAWS